MPAMTIEQDETAYRLRNSGVTFSAIATQLGFTQSQVGNGIRRHAARNGLPDPQQRRSVDAARAYARRAGLPFADATTTTVANAEAAAVVSAIIPTRTFGIEIEFRRPAGQVLDPETIAQALRTAGLNCHAENYNHQNRPHWKLIHDASSDRELVSPILSGPEGLAEVRTAMRVLRELGCRVTRSEGMHVHVYVGDTTPVKVAEVFGFYAARQLSVFDRLNAPVRRTGGRGTYYCQGITPAAAARTMEYARRGTIGSVNGRYVTVNLDSFARYGTVEYRQHAGSLNGRKACDWVELLLATTQYVIDHGDQLPTTIEGTLGGLIGAGLLGRRTAARLATKARDYNFPVGDLDVQHPAAVEPTLAEQVGAELPAATAWADCTCDICNEARAAANRNEVNLTMIGA